MAVLGLHCYMGFSLIVVSKGCSLVVLRLLIAVASRCRQGLGARASVAEAHGLSTCDSWTLEHKVNNCGVQAKFLGGMWDLQGSEI